MIESVLLAKILGSYLLIMSVVMLARPKRFVGIVDEFNECQSALNIAMSMFLFLGLVIVCAHNVWVMAWPTFITVIGWLMVVKWTSYLLFPERFMNLASHLNNKSYYLISGALTFVLSVFLLCKGFSGV